MDAVRFGRALGVGARHAVKTAVSAVDAATAENPSGKTVRPSANTGPAVPAGNSIRTGPGPATPKVARSTANTVTQSRQVTKGLKSGTRRFGEAVWTPFVRLSGVLWLEVSGVFFGIFALFAFGAMWRLHGEWHVGSPGRQQLFGASAMFLVFGYFCVSNFVRARQRERRR
jgi:hypothetical protein